ncbi:hypothetical protein CR203_18720 [Salipaludibacillus neizhouensis]|uniref:Uncharacterized protein n=1 Tax=Salipaludibacillus neizhouensis TaxID=885475 RepID=A0A3A9JYB4_9BACI|nr:hypothetical protein [Salipaludibacillus neizhouensis]RKL65884.1 hypothetical protein CR203_18720 [Salipaludibacillus neizhouensis]
MKNIISMFLMMILLFLVACSHSGLSTYDEMLSESDEEFTYHSLLAENEGSYAAYAVVETEEEVRELKEILQRPFIEAFLTSQENHVDNIKYGGLEVSQIPSYYVFDTETLIYQTHEKEELITYLDEME